MIKVTQHHVVRVKLNSTKTIVSWLGLPQRYQRVQNMIGLTLPRTMTSSLPYQSGSYTSWRDSDRLMDACCMPAKHTQPIGQTESLPVNQEVRNYRLGGVC